MVPVIFFGSVVKINGFVCMFLLIQSLQNRLPIYLASDEILAFGTTNTQFLRMALYFLNTQENNYSEILNSLSSRT